MRKIYKNIILALCIMNITIANATEIFSGSGIEKDMLGKNFTFYVKDLKTCAFKSKIIKNTEIGNNESEFSIQVEEKSCSGVVTKINKVLEIKNFAKEIPPGITFEVSDF